MNKISDIEDLRQFLEKNGNIKLKIKVIAGSRTNSIEFCDDFIKVKVKQRAIEGKANEAIIDFLSDELKLPKRKINILNGHKSSIKTIELGQKN